MTTKRLQLFFILFVLIFQFSFCQEEEEHHDEHQGQTHTKNMTQSQIWGFGFLSGFGISAIGFLTALFMVLCKKIASDNCFEMVIKFFFSLAFGALLGDVMIHILPSAYKTQGSDFRVVAGIFIGAVVFFLILQRIFAACGIVHQHWHSNDCHDDHQGAIQNHNHPNRIQNQETSNQQNKDVNTLKVVPVASTNLIIEDNSENHKNCKHNDHSHTPHDDHSHEHTKQCDQEKSCCDNLKGKGSAGWMNLLGSFIHNFMDGLALGVAFATGESKDFVPVLIAIIAHEIPREMGDVAILMTNKFNGTQTVLCNGIVNLVSLLGVIIGLAITKLDTITKQYVLVFVGGNFIYIAADIWKHLFKNNTFLKNVVEFVGFGIGIASMYLVLLAQNQQGHQH